MNTAHMNEADQLVRYSRRGMWTALALILLIGAAATAQIGFPGSEAAGVTHSLSMLLPIIIVLAAVSLRSAAKGARTDPSGPAMKAILNDELRQHSLKLAFRNAFLAVMIAQPLLALAPTWIAAARPTSMMACLTILTGMAVMLASLLYYDR
jgi:hypothetical protein